MNHVKHSFNRPVEEYELMRKGKLPKQSLEEFLRELDKKEN